MSLAASNFLRFWCRWDYKVHTNCFMQKNWNWRYGKKRLTLHALGNTFHSVTYSGFLRETVVLNCGVCITVIGEPSLHPMTRSGPLCAWFHPVFWEICIKKYASSHADVNSAKLPLLWWILFRWKAFLTSLRGSCTEEQSKIKQCTIVSNCGFCFYSKLTCTARELDSQNQKQMEKWWGRGKRKGK